MHALNLDKGRDELVALVATARVVAVDHRIGMLIRPPFFVKNREIVEGLLRLRQIVDRLAGLLTLAATYAAGEIDQTCKRVRRCPRLPCPGRLNGCGNTRPCSPRHGKKTPSAEFHVHSLLVIKIVSQSYQELCQRILSRTPPARCAAAEDVLLKVLHKQSSFLHPERHRFEQLSRRIYRWSNNCTILDTFDHKP